MLLPLGGLDEFEAPPDGPWIDKEKDKALFDAIRENLRADISLTELDANINDREFADATVNAYFQLWEQHQIEN